MSIEDFARIAASSTENPLEIQLCTRCDTYQYYPRPVCTNCGEKELSLVPASGYGSIYSFSVVHRAVSAEFDAPYVVAIVRLREGPALLTQIVECDPTTLRCDVPVALRWRVFPDGQELPVFAPLGEDEENKALRARS